jgi:xanthine dehydrogenase YagR molybdenum-binding subunit
MSIIQDTVQAVMKTAVALAPDSWIPGGVPDPLIHRKHGHVGQPVSRIDGPLKVKGAARFAAEIALERMVYGALVFSTVPKGRIMALDTQAAERAEGVVLVMTHRNAPKIKRIPYFLQAEKAAAGDDLPVMQDEHIHWNGQPVAVVLAETQEQADHAASLIGVTYEEAPAITSFVAAKAAGRHQASFFGEEMKNEVADAEAALAAAPYKTDEIYSTPRHNHNAIEPHAVTLVWDGDELVVHDCTQAVSHVAWSLAHAFGIDEKAVHVTSPYVGGGFGGKCLWQHQVLAAAAARIAKRPVRMALSREGVYRVVGGRANTEQRVAIGAQKDGRFDALIQTGVAAMTDHNNVPEPFISAARSMYASKSMKLGVETSHMDMLANTFMRAPGESVGTFALESAIDELADRMGMDPIELRLRNEPEKDPVSGLPFSSRHLVEAFRAGAEQFGWSKRVVKPASRREGDWMIGYGVAAATFPYYRMPGGAARITLHRDGPASVEIAAHEMGMGTATALAQVLADRLGLPLDHVVVRYGDSALPGLIIAGGSQQTAAIGASVIAAQRALFVELLKLAGNDSALAGLKPEEIGGYEAGLCKLDDMERFETYNSILSRSQREQVSVEANASPPLEMMHWSMHSYGAMFCEARINAITGEPRVSRFLGSFDCGRILNPKTAASQFRGGIIMGFGLALMEETQIDSRNGRIMNPSLADYHVPVHADVPEIDVIWTDIPDPHTPMGARGIGEIGITGVGAAIANAVFNACGKRVRDLPITLDKLL